MRAQGPVRRAAVVLCAVAMFGAGAVAYGSGGVVALGNAVGRLPAPQEAGPRSLDGLLRGKPCAETVAAWLAVQGARPVALPLAADAPGVRAFAVSTDTLGRWLSLRLDEERVLAAARIESATTTVVTWDAACTATPQVLPGPFAAEGVDRFTDDDLATLLGDGEAGLLYLWSPHMPFSVDGFPAIQEAAQRANLTVTFLVDPAAHPDYVARIAVERDLPAGATRALGSVDLLFRGLTNHAPSIQLYVGGEMAGPVLSGVRSADAYLEFIEGFLR